MILFLLAALLTVAVAAALVLPLMKPHAPPPPAERYNAAVYRQQLAELDADVGREALPDSEAAGARIEIERRLLAASRKDAPAAAVAEHRRAPWWISALAAGGLATGGAGLYFAVGRPSLPDQPFKGDRQAVMAGPATSAPPGQPAPDAASADQQQFAQLIDALKAKMAANPSDPKGWLLLARGLMRLEKPVDAQDAYQHVLDLGVSTPAVLVEAGEARVAATGGTVDRDSQALFKRAAKADAALPQPRYYLALAKAQAGDTAGALADWRAIVAAAPADAPYLPAIKARIAEAEHPGATPVGPTGEQAAAAGALPEADQRAMIDAMVAKLSTRLQAQPGDVNGWRRLARAYTVLGKGPDAAKAWTQVLRLDPADPDAKAALSR